SFQVVSYEDKEKLDNSTVCAASISAVGGKYGNHCPFCTAPKSPITNVPPSIYTWSRFALAINSFRLDSSSICSAPLLQAISRAALRKIAIALQSLRIILIRCQ